MPTISLEQISTKKSNKNHNRENYRPTVTWFSWLGIVVSAYFCVLKTVVSPYFWRGNYCKSLFFVVVVAVSAYFTLLELM